MIIRRGLKLNGRPWIYTAPAPIVAPGQVGALTAGPPTVTTIPVTFTAPTTGTAPFTYTGFTSPHGTATWTQNSGTFTGGTSDQFIGLMGATDYDLEINATNGAGSSVTQILSGVTTATYIPPAVFTGAANRYDIVLSASAAAPGAAVTATLYPNGTWNGETITPFAASGSGTFSPTRIVTTNGSNANPTFTYTPSSAGEHAVGATNSGTLYNPHSAPLNAFATSSGAAQTLTATVAPAQYGLLDPQPRQFDTLATLATGFSGSAGKGYGSVALNISAIGGATSGLFAKLYDANSSGATTAVGSGTALQATPVQVYGSVSATGIVHVMLPCAFAGSYYFVELATDAAFTNPVRIPQRIVVCLVIGIMGRSQEAGFAQWYFDGSVPTGETWNSAMSMYTSSSVYPANPGGSTPVFWRQTGVAAGASHADGSDPGGPSGGAQAAGRITAAEMNVNVAIVGAAATGGGVDDFINHDGSLRSGGAFTGTLAATGLDGKFRWFWAASQDGWGNDDSTYPGTFTEYQTRYLGAMDWVAKNYPACAVQGWGAGGTGRPEPNGSAAITAGAYPGADSPGPGAGRLQNIFEIAEVTNPMIVSKGNHAWAQFVGGHGSKSSRRIYTQTGWRQLSSAELAINGGLQTQARGPTLAQTGTCSTATRLVRLYGKLNGGGGLQTVQITQTDPNYTVALNVATAAQLADLLSLYPYDGGANPGYSTVTPDPGNTWIPGLRVQIDSVTINYSNLPAGYDFSLDAALTGTTGITYSDGSTAAMPSTFRAHWAVDLQASANHSGYIVQYSNGGGVADSRATFIADTQVSGPWEWGRHLRPKLDIVITVGA